MIEEIGTTLITVIGWFGQVIFGLAGAIGIPEEAIILTGIGLVIWIVYSIFKGR